MTAPKYQNVEMPLGEMPKGKGWAIVSGSLTHNLWRRAAPKAKSTTRRKLIAQIDRRAATRPGG